MLNKINLSFISKTTKQPNIVLTGFQTNNEYNVRNSGHCDCFCFRGNCFDDDCYDCDCHCENCHCDCYDCDCADCDCNCSDCGGLCNCDCY